MKHIIILGVMSLFVFGYGSAFALDCVNGATLEVVKEGDNNHEVCVFDDQNSYDCDSDTVAIPSSKGGYSCIKLSAEGIREKAKRLHEQYTEEDVDQEVHPPPNVFPTGADAASEERVKAMSQDDCNKESNLIWEEDVCKFRPLTSDEQAALKAQNEKVELAKACERAGGDFGDDGNGFKCLEKLESEESTTDPNTTACNRSYDAALSCCGAYDNEEGLSIMGQMKGGSNIVSCIINEANKTPGFAEQVAGYLGSGWMATLTGASSLFSGAKGVGSMCKTLETVNNSLAGINTLGGTVCAMKTISCHTTCSAEVNGEVPGGNQAKADACKSFGSKSAMASFAKAGVNFLSAYKSRSCEKKASVAAREKSSGNGGGKNGSYEVIRDGGQYHRIATGSEKPVSMRTDEEILRENTLSSGGSPKVQGYDKSFAGRGGLGKLPKLQSSKTSNDKKRKVSKKRKKRSSGGGFLAGGTPESQGVVAESSSGGGLKFKFPNLRKPANKKTKGPHVRNKKNGKTDPVLRSGKNIFHAISEGIRKVYYAGN